MEYHNKNLSIDSFLSLCRNVGAPYLHPINEQANTMETLQTLPIYITEQDKNRLQSMIQKYLRGKDQREDLTTLSAELNRAVTVDADQIPPNVVTMNSKISIVDLDTSEKLSFTLVFPEDAEPDDNKFSVLAPIGSGVLGYRVEDEFEWEVPAGIRRFKITKISYQPEAKKHFHL